MKRTKLLVVLLSIFMVIGLVTLPSKAATTLNTDIDVVKTWDDNNNEDGTRPESITVYLKNGDKTVQTITISENADHEWKGKFTDVPVYDSSTGKVINYTVEEAPVKDYSTSYKQGDVVYVYKYPTNIYTGTYNMDPVGAETVNVTSGSGSWKINQGVNTDTIVAPGVKFNDLLISKATFTEYDASGKEVTDDADRQFKVESDGIYYYPTIASSTISNVTSDHYFTVTFPNGATMLDKDNYGEKRDVTLTVSNVDLIKTKSGNKMRILLNNPDNDDALEVGPVDYPHSIGGVSIDINVKIDGATSGNMVLPFVDIDIVGQSGDPRIETVMLSEGIEKTIHTVKLTSTDPTAVKYTQFEVKGGKLHAFATGKDYDTFQSGFVGIADLSASGFDIGWMGTRCSTVIFGEIVPMLLKCTVDELIEGGVGGTISEQGDWRSRAYGEAKVITCTPDELYHISHLSVDGVEIKIENFDANGYQAVPEVGWTKELNTGKETGVKAYQKANGVVDIYLPIQYYAVNDAEPSGRVDHWIDVSYETNGTVTSYEIINKQVVDYIDLVGTKTWYDILAQHDNESLVKLDLYQIDADGKETKLNVEPVWDGDTYTFKKLVETDAEGNKYTYRVEEQPIDGYRTIYSGKGDKDITNIAIADIEVIKYWDDNYDENQVRPDSIEVTLLRDGEVVEDMEDAVVELTATDGWTYTWKNLSLYDDKGHEYIWSVKEANIPNYELSETTSIQTTLTITNKYVPVPVTGDSYTKFYVGAGMTVIGLLGMIFVVMKRKIANN
ncbi:MAG: Cna B-type domain-containing protein [Erysipelotrichaceae bacterium]|nr:Cna B-type domain-containing protein [Erysipelotrichaceae bacterium]